MSYTPSPLHPPIFNCIRASSSSPSSFPFSSAPSSSSSSPPSFPFSSAPSSFSVRGRKCWVSSAVNFLFDRFRLSTPSFNFSFLLLLLTISLHFLCLPSSAVASSPTCPDASWVPTGRRCIKVLHFPPTPLGSARVSTTAAPPSSLLPAPAPSSSYPRLSSLLLSEGSWVEGMELCLNSGGVLATLHSAAEDRAVHMITDSLPLPCWIGLRRYLLKRPQRGWIWVDSAESLKESGEQGFSSSSTFAPTKGSFMNWGGKLKTLWKVVPPEEKCGEIDNDGWGERPCWGMYSKLTCAVCTTLPYEDLERLPPQAFIHSFDLSKLWLPSEISPDDDAIQNIIDGWEGLTSGRISPSEAVSISTTTGLENSSGPPPKFWSSPTAHQRSPILSNLSGGGREEQKTPPLLLPSTTTPETFIHISSIDQSPPPPVDSSATTSASLSSDRSPTLLLQPMKLEPLTDPSSSFPSTLVLPSSSSSSPGAVSSPFSLSSPSSAHIPPIAEAVTDYPSLDSLPRDATAIAIASLRGSSSSSSPPTTPSSSSSSSLSSAVPLEEWNWLSRSPYRVEGVEELEALNDGRGEGPAGAGAVEDSTIGGGEEEEGEEARSSGGSNGSVAILVEGQEKDLSPNPRGVFADWRVVIMIVGFTALAIVLCCAGVLGICVHRRMKRDRKRWEEEEEKDMNARGKEAGKAVYASRGGEEAEVTHMSEVPSVDSGGGASSTEGPQSSEDGFGGGEREEEEEVRTGWSDDGWEGVGGATERIEEESEIVVLDALQRTISGGGETAMAGWKL